MVIVHEYYQLRLSFGQLINVYLHSIKYDVLIFVFSYIDPIDCESDPCHLAWLIRDNQYLFGVIQNATCSNGKTLEELNPEDFNYDKCPVL